MIVENQKVKVKWIAKNRKHYENKGYVFTKWYEEFEVMAEDLSDGASVQLLFSCDNPSCDKIFPRKYSSYMKGNKQSFCCLECAQNPKKRIVYTKESLIENFWRYYKEFKKFPQSIDFDKLTTYPSSDTVKRNFGCWDTYLKEVGVIDSKTTDGWYINDEAILRKYYPNNKIDAIINQLMVKRLEQTIRMKANSMGLKVKENLKYEHKYKNENVKSEIIQEAKNFYMKNNRSPYRFELSFSRRAIEENWKSYNDFLIDCEIPIFRREVSLKTKEDGVLFLQDLKSLLGRNPTVTDVDEYGVHKNWFSNMFGSFTAAIFKSGLIPLEDYDMELRLNNSIEGFKNLYKILNRVPHYREYQEYASKNNLFNANSMMERLEGIKSYTDLCIFLIGDSNRNIYNEEDLIKNLTELKDKLGRVPMAKELIEHGYPSRDVYRNFFKVRYFNDIIRRLGWEPIGQDSLYKTDEELLDDYLNLYEKLERIPLRDDIDEEEGMCHSGTYITRFGGISKICELLDLNYNELIAESQMGSGTTCFDNNGDLCRSIPEMKITNMLIDLNIYYVKEYPYKNITNDKDKRRFDWYLPDYDIFIEYFGLFYINKINNNDRNGVYVRKALKKIEDCKKLGKVLIDLYPRDSKNGYLKLTNQMNNIIQKVV